MDDPNAGSQPDRKDLESRPPLEAMEAAADNENLYAGMLLANKNFGWARLSYQKNVSRWKNWRPRK